MAYECLSLILEFVPYMHLKHTSPCCSLKKLKLAHTIHIGSFAACSAGQQALVPQHLMQSSLNQARPGCPIETYAATQGLSRTDVLLLKSENLSLSLPPPFEPGACSLTHWRWPLQAQAGSTVVQPRATNFPEILINRSHCHVGRHSSLTHSCGVASMHAQLTGVADAVGGMGQ